MGATSNAMAPIRPAKCTAQTPYHKRRAMLRTVLLISTASAGLTLHSIHGNYCKTPQNNSKLSGAEWVQELAYGHPSRCRNNLGMNKHVFMKLLQELQGRTNLVDTKHVEAKEQLAIFLYLATTGLSNRKTQERLQRSAETISK